MGERNKLCISVHASKKKPDWLPLHIHVSRSRFIASWHNVRTINVSYVARLSHYRDSLTCLLFQIQNVHSSGKQDIVGLRVPSVEERCSLLSITWADNWGSQTPGRHGSPQSHSERRRGRGGRIWSIAARFPHSWEKLSVNIKFSRFCRLVTPALWEAPYVTCRVEIALERGGFFRWEQSTAGVTHVHITYVMLHARRDALC